MNHYQVKFLNDDGQIQFGIYDEYSDDAKKLAQQGLGICLVEDATLPKSYLVKEKNLIDIPLNMGRWSPAEHKFVGQDEFHQFIDAEFEKTKQISDALDGIQVGSLFGIGVGDGTAWYIVTKINKKTAKVEWRGFCLDRWTDNYLGFGRSVPLDYLKCHIGRANAIKQLFGT